MFTVRAARGDDLDALVEMARLSGPGFTSLPEDREYLARRLGESGESFSGHRREGKPERFMLMMEDAASGEIVGCAAVKSSVGLARPFFNFRLITIAQASAQADKRFDLEALMLVNDFAGCTEVGSLFLKPEARGGGVGRLLAQARYLLIASEPARFGERVLAELRGVVDDKGRSPFWDNLGQIFFRMNFNEADRLSGVLDNQFILDLMPKFPIYVDLLAEEARAVIGRTHPDGGGARRLLEWEGFRYDRVIDIFDGGPLVSSPRDAIRTLRESQLRAVEIGATGPDATHALVSNNRVEGFACVRAPVVISEGRVMIGRDAARALDLEPGDEARVWRSE